MTPEHFRAITEKYDRLRIAVVGDFCLDSYLELDPAKNEISIETSLTVYNLMNVRAQSGGAGTELNDLAALSMGVIFPVGFAGEDGGGYELCRALAARPGVRLDHFFQTNERHTFTYCKPLILEPGQSPRELNRLDQKNWTPTPLSVAERLSAAAISLVNDADDFVLLSHGDQPETGVLTARVLATIGEIAQANPQRQVFADSRHSLRDFPSVIFEMNAVELEALTGLNTSSGLSEVAAATANLASRNGYPVIVTLAERGIVGVLPDGQTEHVPAVRVRGEIDIVDAGDSVTANLTLALAALVSTQVEESRICRAFLPLLLTQEGGEGWGEAARFCLDSPLLGPLPTRSSWGEEEARSRFPTCVDTNALAGGATLREALELANAAASIVVHQPGTAGTAAVAQLRELLFASERR